MPATLGEEEKVYLQGLGFDETSLQKQIANNPTLLRLTPEEQAMFLREHRKCALATIDQNGFPHLDAMDFPHLDAMDFMFRDGAFYMTSYDQVQKVINIRRDPKVAIMVETGNTDAELKGIMARGECEIIEDPEAVDEACAWLGGGSTVQCSVGAERNAPNRVVLKMQPRKIVTWNYSKLGRLYGIHP